MKKYSLFCILFSIYLLDSISIFSQMPEIKHIVNFRNGINSFADDGDYLWIANYKEGIIHFNKNDGTYKYYDTPDSAFRKSYCEFVRLDKSNRLWIAASDRGFYLFENGEFTKLNTKDLPLTELQITDMNFDNGNNLWFSTRDGNLVKYDWQKWEVFNKSNSGMRLPDIVSFTFDNDGNIWINSEYGEILRYDFKEWKVFNKNNGHFYIRSPGKIICDKNNNLFMGVNDLGLLVYDGNDWVKYNSNNSPLKAGSIFNVAADSRNNKWITSTDGIFMLNSNDTVNYNRLNSELKDDLTLSIFADNSDNIWFSTYSEDLVRFDGKNFKTYNLGFSGFPNNYVSAIEIDKNDTKWIALEYLELIKYDSVVTIFNSFNSELPGLSHLLYYDKISLDSSGGIWLSNSTELIYFKDKKCSVFNNENSVLKFSKIVDLFTDAKGNEWVCTDLGIYIYDGNNFVKSKLDAVIKLASDEVGNIWGCMSNYTIAELNNDKWIFYDTPNDGENRDFVIDKKGNKWLADEFGLYKFGTDKKWQVYNVSNSILDEDKFWMMTIDKNDVLWGITWQGNIYSVDGDKWTKYDDFSIGSEPNHITGFVADKAGNKWIATSENGLFVFGENGLFLTDLKELSDNGSISLIFPNPAKDKIMINIQNLNNDTKYVISDLNGKVLQSGLFDNTGINISSLNSGAYILMIKDNLNKTVMKFIKE